MSNILEKRRIFTSERRQDYEYRMVKNPLYNQQEMVEAMREGFYYDEPEYIEKEVPVSKTVKRSHIEYKIVCDYCKGKGWVRRKDARYCCGNCRKMAYRERKRNSTNF